MNTPTLRLPLIVLSLSCSSLALAQPQASFQPHPAPSQSAPSSSRKGSPASTSLKNYIQQVETATNRFVSLEVEFKDVLESITPQASASPEQQIQATAENKDKFDPSSAQGQKVLHMLNDLEKVALSYRNFNPVPKSAAKVDEEFVDFSLKMQQGLDLLHLYLFAQDNDELEDRAFKKLDEAMSILPIATSDLLALKHTLEAQQVRKTYVPG